MYVSVCVLVSIIQKFKRNFWNINVQLHGDSWFCQNTTKSRMNYLQHPRWMKWNVVWVIACAFCVVVVQCDKIWTMIVVNSRLPPLPQKKVIVVCYYLYCACSIGICGEGSGTYSSSRYIKQVLTGKRWCFVNLCVLDVGGLRGGGESSCFFQH